MAFIGEKTRVWNRETANDGLLLDAEFNRIYENFRTLIPVGTIMAWLPGYFTDGSNGGFTGVTTDLSDLWKECDGTEPNDVDSPIFDSAGKHLPNLTDDRFLMGTTMGTAGGSNDAMAHTHGFTNPNIPEHYHSVNNVNIGNDAPDHSHAFYLWHDTGIGGPDWAGINMSGNTRSTGGASTRHSHPISGYAGNTSGVSGDSSFLATGGAVGAVTESRTNQNLPKYLSCKYIIRIK